MIFFRQVLKKYDEYIIKIIPKAAVLHVRTGIAHLNWCMLEIHQQYIALPVVLKCIFFLTRALCDGLNELVVQR